jgi:5-methylcytosine-specific restriction endonuclease McrA
VRIEYKRRRGKQRELLRSERRELEKQWRNVKRSLHGHFRPVILERDGYKCRVCGQSRNLEMARLFEDSLYVPEIRHKSPEVRYSERNMFTLCEECHRRFDSLHGRFCRFKRGISTVEEAVEFLHQQFGRLSQERDNSG